MAEDDATIQHERAVKFDTTQAARRRIITPEELRQAIRECDEAASYAGVVDTPTVDMDEADDRPVRGCGAFWDFSEFCGGLDCLGYGRESESSSIDSTSPITNKHEPQRMGSEETLQLDGHFLGSRRGAL